VNATAPQLSRNPTAIVAALEGASVVGGLNAIDAGLASLGVPV